MQSVKSRRGKVSLVFIFILLLFYWLLFLWTLVNEFYLGPILPAVYFVMIVKISCIHVVMVKILELIEGIFIC